jgi:polyketide biosynthesis enoyl-CoA hydratase PksH
MNYETIKVRMQDTVAFLQLDRPEAGNTINGTLVRECTDAVAHCEQSCTVLVVEGSPDVFCLGADFRAGEQQSQDPQPLYDLWMRLAGGPFVSVAHVRGRVNAGGVGFVAACDIALASADSQFALSELLFGLMPACVLPFLIRRVGLQPAHYMTLSTSPISAQQAQSWGLVDACEQSSDALLRRHLLRLRRLSKAAIVRYKDYIHSLDASLRNARELALAANREVFSDARNLEGIARYAQTGVFPWENGKS